MSAALTFIALSFSAAFGVIGASVGLNALIKSNQEKGFLKSHASPAQLQINTDDVLFSGIVVAVVCGIISLISFTSLQLMAIPSMRKWADKTKKLRGFLMLFFVLWLLAAHIPYTLFFATRDAIVKAWVMGTQLPQSIVDETSAKLGATSVYKQIYYLRLLAILPWVTFLFGSISVVAIFTSPSMSSDESSSHSPAREAMSEKMRAQEEA